MVIAAGLGRAGVVVAALTALGVAACGGSATTFVSAWRSPKAEPLAMRGEKVAAVVMMKDEMVRRNAEDVLAREITHYGAQGVPMYTLMKEAPLENEAAAKAAIEAAGVKGAVVMRPMGKETTTETEEYWSSPYYGGYWGGYYGHGWASPYGPPAAYAIASNPHDYGPHAQTMYVGSSPATKSTVTTTTESVVVEVLVYSLKQNMLVWAGKSHTTEPKNVDQFVTQLAAKTVQEMGEMGLLSSK
ncbi:MAG TPA: hypothetical protein VIW29_13325 [Polyangiaceae bacterium]